LICWVLDGQFKGPIEIGGIVIHSLNQYRAFCLGQPFKGKIWMSTFFASFGVMVLA